MVEIEFDNEFVRGISKIENFYEHIDLQFKELHQWLG